MSIAVIIPAYKESDYIEKLIFSILKFLKDPIIIIVDDSPNKEIQEKIKQFNNVHYIYRGKNIMTRFNAKMIQYLVVGFFLIIEDSVVHDIAHVLYAAGNTFFLKVFDSGFCGAKK